MAASEKRVPGLKHSFASVAARAAVKEEGSRAPSELPRKSNASSQAQKDGPTKETDAEATVDLQRTMAHLTVSEPSSRSSIGSEQEHASLKKAELRVDDDQTQISTSSTKAPSLDDKSITSGQAFALDEKESLRPDDSASVQAVDDDDFASGPASGAPNSRMGSEAGSRSFRDQFNEISENTPLAIPRSHPLARRTIADIAEEDPQILIAATGNGIISPMTGHPDVPAIVRPPIDKENRLPDEKLFEALESVKDRMFLLRLEQDIIHFIKNSSEPSITLPPCNSFCRLLAHKLADYYALTHFVDNAVSAVTLYRTPYCKVPKPLSALAESRNETGVVPLLVVQPAMKIMRRPGLGKDSHTSGSGFGTTESSAVASKATSETDAEEQQQRNGTASPTESALAKDKGAMTRAEREARYKEKREELFGPQSEDTESVDAGNEPSRSSSRNEEKKRKKKSKICDDGFEARSQFNIFYPAMHYSGNPYEHVNPPGPYYNMYHMQPENPLQHGLPSYQSPTLSQQGVSNTFAGTPTPARFPTTPLQGHGNTGFPAAEHQGHGNTGFPSQAQFPMNDQQTPTQYFSVPHMPGSMHPHSPAGMLPNNVGPVPGMPSPSQQQPSFEGQAWLHNAYNQPRAPQPPQQHASYPSHSAPMPYQFGQLPFQHPSQDNKMQHPLPGSYNRPPAFNPQTRAFIPIGQPGPPPPMHMHLGSPIPSLARMPPMNQPNGHTFPPMPAFSAYPPPAMPPTYSPSQVTHSTEYKYAPSRKLAPEVNTAPISTQPPSSLSKWASVAKLPPKPPPPQPPSMPNTLPANNQFTTIIQPLNSGQPMPQYHNGVYSMPNHS